MTITIPEIEAQGIQLDLHNADLLAKLLHDAGIAAIAKALDKAAKSKKGYIGKEAQNILHEMAAALRAIEVEEVLIIEETNS